MLSIISALRHFGIINREPEPDLEQQAVARSSPRPDASDAVTALDRPPRLPRLLSATVHRLRGSTPVPSRTAPSDGPGAVGLTACADERKLAPWLSLMTNAVMDRSLKMWGVPFEHAQVPRFTAAFTQFLVDLVSNVPFQAALVDHATLVVHDPQAAGGNSPADTLERVHGPSYPGTGGLTVRLADAEDGFAKMFGKTVEVGGAEVTFLLECKGPQMRHWHLQAVAHEPDDDRASTLSGATEMGAPTRSNTIASVEAGVGEIVGRAT